MGKGRTESDQIELQDYDLVIEPESGFEQTYAILNKSCCTSSKYAHFINYFGNEGGFDMILDVLENGKIDDNLDTKVIAALTTTILHPHKSYYADFVNEFGARITSAVKVHLLNASAVGMRDIGA